MTGLFAFAAVVSIALAVCATVAAYHHIERLETQLADVHAERDAAYLALNELAPLRDRYGNGTPVFDALIQAQFKKQVNEL